MGWLSTALDIATLAAVASNSAKTAQLQEMSQQAEMVEAVRTLCRDYVFRANQAKEDMLEYKTTKPLAVTAGLYYIEAEIQESGITTEIFRDISDKEYLASTLRSIRQNRRELLELLNPDQKQLAETAAQSLREYESLAFVVRSYDDAIRLQNLFSEQAQLERNKPKSSLFGGNRELRDWQARIDQVKSQTLSMGGRDALARWDVQRRAFGDKSQDELTRRLANMEILLQNVFEDRRFVPRLELIPTVKSGDELDQLEMGMTFENMTGKTLALPAAGGVAVQSSDGRVPCPNCGYRNTTHRTICKQCHIAL